MTIRKYATLNEVATIFNVHPRTILRAMAGEHNTFWSDDEDWNDQRIPLEEIARAYGTKVKTICAVLDRRDDLLNPAEAARVLGIAPRTFRERLTAGRYQKIGLGGIARYLHSKIISDLIANSPDFAE